MSAEQRTEEWFKDRAGKFTGSRFADVLAFGEPKTALCLIAPDGSIEKKLGNGDTAESRADKLREQGRIVEVREYAPGAPLKARQDLIWQLTAERMSGRPKDQISSQSLAWGTDVEPYAKEAYELETGNTVVEGGFIKHPRYGEFCGVSPDGLVGDEGGVEIKCPKASEIHLERFIDGVPGEYIPQIQGCMWVTGRKWWDFVSYDPRFSGSPYEMLRIRVERDDAFITKLESAVLQAEAEVNALIKSIRAKVENQI